MVSKSWPGFVGVDDYLALPRDRNTWLLRHLIPIGGAALLYGAEKTGKSYLAIQLALALSGQADNWLGFQVVRWGKVLYLQLDTPRSLWANRFEEMIKKGGLKYDSKTLLLGDRDSIEYHPFDILQANHATYLRRLVEQHEPIAVIIDTLRMSHSGDEDSSTVSRNVLANLVGSTHPAALIVVSHSRKPNPEGTANVMADHRGSSNVTASMDAIMRLTKKKLFYAGRSIEEGDITLQRLDNGLWVPKDEARETEILHKVAMDASIPSLRAKAVAIASATGISEDAAMSRLRRLPKPEKDVCQPPDDLGSKPELNPTATTTSQGVSTVVNFPKRDTPASPTESIG